VTTDDLRLLGQSIVDTCNALDAAQVALSDSAAKLAVAEQVATEDAAEIAQLKSDNAALQAYKDAHPDAPPPPPPPPPPASKVGWGFNLFNGWNGYSQPAAAESSSVMLARLKTTFGPFGWAKVFNPGFLPATFAKGNQGETDPLCPATHIIECFNWTDGTIANGSHDAALTAYAQSVPAGKHVILSRNEIDNHSPNWALYVADMDHLYDLLTGLTLAGKVEVWDCFMVWSLDAASGPQWKDSWTNPAKRHGIVWDHYWNTSTSDKTGKTAMGLVTSKMKQLGLTRWAIGETGDRRPGTAKSTETNDATRAASLTNRLNAVLAADPAPEGVCWFDVIGSTGDHRILPADTATAAVLRGFMQA
jgi:hypothetical protein